jgi:branched-chain amino acid transport system ATP-binding protein
MLEISDLNVTYAGTVQALRGVSLKVANDGVVAVLGSNGAGKSTLLRAISGTLKMQNGRVNSGGITFDGDDITDGNAAAIVSKGIVQVPEGRRIFGRLSVEENLKAGAATVRNRAERTRAMANVYELFPMLAEFRTKRGVLLSGGQQQMLAIGRALMSNPKVLLLDEPSLGLAPMVVAQIGDIIKNIHERGTAVMLVEQNAAMALSVATHAFVMELGSISLQGPASELAASDEVRRLYLGSDSDEDRRPALMATAASGRHLSKWSA